MEEVLHAISVVGFPITAFLMMFWLAKTTIEKNTNAILDLKECILKK